MTQAAKTIERKNNKALIFVTIIAVALVLSGCTTMMERSAHKKCFSKDWLAAGFDAAKSGEPFRESWARDDKKCLTHNVWSNRDDFTKGYELGLEVFCTEENGYEFGQRNLAYHAICDEDQQHYFDTAYRDGHVLHQARNFLQRSETDLYDAQQFIEYATHRRRELARQIESGKLDERTTKRALNERQRLRSNREHTRRELFSLRSAISVAEQRRASLRQVFEEQYYPEGEQPAYSKDQSLVSENILISKSALILYHPTDFEPGYGAKYKSRIKEFTKYITDTYPRTLRYQVVQNLPLTFIPASGETIELDPARKFAHQPHLLIWLNDKLKLYQIEATTVMPMEPITLAINEILQDN